MKKNTFIQKMLMVDRRIIYLILALVVIIPMIKPLGLKNMANKETKDLYDFINELGNEKNPKPILISGDYEPSTVPELDPMLKAILRHAFRKNVPVVIMTLFPAGKGVVEKALNVVKREYPRKEYGKDYVFLGYKPGYSVVIMGIGSNIKTTFPTDAYNTSVDSLPLMKNLTTYDDFSLVISISGTGVGENWITYANARYHAKVALGVTAVMASDYFPYLQSKQIIGLLGGIRGAAEYEELIGVKGLGSKGMEGQNFAHLIIILFIILGNIAFFIDKAQQKKAR